MKRRLALMGLPLLLALAFVLPASTAAATGYTFTIVSQHCYGSQGQNVYFRVKLTSSGTTPANKLTIKSKSQYYSGGKWHNYYNWALDKTTFTRNGSPHSIDYSYTHEGTNQYNWRIVSTLAAWNGTHKLATKTLHSHSC